MNRFLINYFLGLLFILFAAESKAGESQWVSYLKKDSISVSSQIEIDDPTALSSGSISVYDAKVFLIFDKRSRKDLETASSWSYTIGYKIDFYNSSDSIVATDTSQIDVSFNTTAPELRSVNLHERNYSHIRLTV